MLAKKNTKNQITLPETVATQFTEVEYFDISTDSECIVLRPLQKNRASEVRAQLAQLGIAEQDVANAIALARSTPEGHPTGS